MSNEPFTEATRCAMSIVPQLRIPDFIHHCRIGPARPGVQSARSGRRADRHQENLALSIASTQTAEAADEIQHQRPRHRPGSRHADQPGHRRHAGGRRLYQRHRAAGYNHRRSARTRCHPLLQSGSQSRQRRVGFTRRSRSSWKARTSTATPTISCRPLWKTLPYLQT